MDKRTIVLKPALPPPSKWKLRWLWLTSAQYRKEVEMVHPLLFVWRCLMFPFVVATLLLYCAMVCIAFGAEQARRTFADAQ